MFSETNNNANGQDGFKLQDPEEDIKPRVGIEAVPDLVNRIYGLKVVKIQQLPSYDDLNYHILVDAGANNRYIPEVNADGYVVKILNSLQSAAPAIIDAQHALCKYVRERGVSVQIPAVNKEGKEWSIETFKDPSKGKDGILGPYLVRMVTFVPGTIFHKTPYIPPSFYNVGLFVGKLTEAMKGFHHSFYDSYEMIWNLTKIPLLRDFLAAVKDTRDVAVVTEVINAFEREIIPLYPKFSKGLIHGDVNEQNLIMTEIANQDDVPRDQRVHDVRALLDFNDVYKAYSVMDIATCIAYMSIDCPDEGQIDAGGHVLAGYLQSCSLNVDEFDSLKTLVCCRLCQSIVLGAHSYSLQPGNTYLLTTSKRGWPLLHRLWKIPAPTLHSRWREIIKSYDNHK